MGSKGCLSFSRPSGGALQGGWGQGGVTAGTWGPCWGSLWKILPKGVVGGQNQSLNDPSAPCLADDESPGLYGFLHVIVHSAKGFKQSASKCSAHPRSEGLGRELGPAQGPVSPRGSQQLNRDALRGRSAVSPPPDLYCTLEVDSFGYFVSKAKTRVFRDTTEPQWNEVRGGWRMRGRDRAHPPALVLEPFRVLGLSHLLSAPRSSRLSWKAPSPCASSATRNATTRPSSTRTTTKSWTRSWARGRSRYVLGLLGIFLPNPVPSGASLLGCRAGRRREPSAGVWARG